jgi:hypothetical protein
MRRAFRDAARWTGGLALLTSGCASAPAPRPDLDRAFAQIQEHEAAIVRAELQAAQPGVDAARARELGDGALREAAALCTLARDTADRDALARCERAEDTAHGIAARAAAVSPR